MSELVRFLICCKILISEIAAVVDDLYAFSEEFWYDLCRYAVWESRDNEIRVLCHIRISEIFAKIINDSAEFGIDL